QPTRYRDGSNASGLEDSSKLCNRLVVLRDVFEYLGGDDPVEVPVGVRQPERVAAYGSGGAGGGGFTRFRHGGEHLLDLGETVGVLVQRGDFGPTPVRFEGVPTRSGADVEQSVSRKYGESVEIHCQHPASPVSIVAYVAPRPHSTLWWSRRPRTNCTGPVPVACPRYRAVYDAAGRRGDRPVRWRAPRCLRGGRVWRTGLPSRQPRAARRCH